MAKVLLGYFEDFKSSNTLLIEGDPEGLRQLAGLLRSLENGSTNIIEVHTQPFIESHHGIHLIAARAHRDLVARTSSSSNEFRWERTDLSWRDAADKVEVLVESRSAHHCLDAVGDDVVIEVCKGEYGDDWWRAHG